MGAQIAFANLTKLAKVRYNIDHYVQKSKDFLKVLFTVAKLLDLVLLLDVCISMKLLLLKINHTLDIAYIGNRFSCCLDRTVGS